MAVFKMMNEEFVEGLISGKNVRIGTTNQYRFLEKGIGDKDENSTTTYVDYYDSEAPFSLEKVHMMQNIARVWPTISKLKNIKIQGINFSYIGNNYPIFCTSLTIDEIVVNRLIEDSGKLGSTPYDYVVPIIDLKGFGRTISDQFFKLVDSRKTWHGLPVRYLQQTLDARNPAPFPSPFIKSPYFAAQKEFRFAVKLWVPTHLNYMEFSLEFPNGTFGEPFPLANYQDHIKQYRHP